MSDKATKQFQHLYLALEAPGQGLGVWVQEQVKPEARTAFDVSYVWPVAQGALA